LCATSRTRTKPGRPIPTKNYATHVKGYERQANSTAERASGATHTAHCTASPKRPRFLPAATLSSPALRPIPQFAGSASPHSGHTTSSTLLQSRNLAKVGSPLDIQAKCAVPGCVLRCVGAIACTSLTSLSDQFQAHKSNQSAQLTRSL
jgi:hypothetical protein